ncbi:hypothetical protein ACT453_61250, partial [Bacillus sp. D-CC]
QRSDLPAFRSSLLKDDLPVLAREMQADQTFEIFAGAELTTKVARDEELDATVVIGSKASF